MACFLNLSLHSLVVRQFGEPAFDRVLVFVQVFCVLAEALIGDTLDDEEEPEGITHECLFRLCRERFLVSSDVTLNTHLGEFRDHDLVKTRRAADGSSLLYIPLNAAMLQQIVGGLALDGADE